MGAKIAIYGNRSQGECLKSLPDFFKLLEESGFRLFVHTKFFHYLEENCVNMATAVPCDFLPPDVSMVISLGGDGTFLRAARWIGHREIPIFGINTGHLGFLASCSLPEAPDMLARIVAGEIRIEKRMLLEISSESLPKDQWIYALNEVVFMRHGTSMLSIETYANDRSLADYRGDGLIVATPTGSTAYSLSAGGPVIEPTIDCMCLTPVAVHTLTLRPLVVGADTIIRLRPYSRSGKFILSIDDESLLLEAKDDFIIRKAPFSALLIQKKEDDYPSILRQKLLWNN